jgi:FtsH-binding integral membrane protein
MASTSVFAGASLFAYMAP